MNEMFVLYLQQIYEPHQSAVCLNYVPGLPLLAMLLTSLMAMIHRLLLLSGDVEMNPGPLGQHNEGEMVQCVMLMQCNGSDCLQILHRN